MPGPGNQAIQCQIPHTGRYSEPWNQNFYLILKKKKNQAIICFITRGRNISQKEGKTALRTGQYIVITVTKVSKQKTKGSDQSNVEKAGKIPLTKKGFKFQD